MKSIIPALIKAKANFKPILKSKQEEWVEIEGYEGIYSASSLGQIKSHDRYVDCGCRGMRFYKSRILVYMKDKDLYDKINLVDKHGNMKQFRVHRLIASCFIPNGKNLPQVNHKNGIKTDNRVVNLEWVTPQENIKHAIQHGFRGVRSSDKLSQEEIQEIKNRIKQGVLQKKIAKEFSINPSYVSYINRKK